MYVIRSLSGEVGDDLNCVIICFETGDIFFKIKIGKREFNQRIGNCYYNRLSILKQKRC